MELLERELEKAVIELFEKAHLFIFKPSKFSDRKHAMRNNDRGAPDLLLFHKGSTVALELKTKVGRQSEDQKRFQARLEQNKIPYYVIRSMEDAMNVYLAVQMM